MAVPSRELQAGFRRDAGAHQHVQPWLAPPVRPLQVLEVEDVVQDEASRRRMRVLAHLPLTATFKLCEVDLSCECPGGPAC